MRRAPRLFPEYPFDRRFGVFAQQVFFERGNVELLRPRVKRTRRSKFFYGMFLYAVCDKIQFPYPFFRYSSNILFCLPNIGPMSGLCLYVVLSAW